MMPAEKRTAEDKKKAKAQERKYYVRLARGGQNGEEGLARYFLGGKLYRREGIYRVDQRTRVTLKRTGKFEDIMPDDLEQAKIESKAGRGMTLTQRTRLKRREAQKLRRRRTMPQVDDLDDDHFELSDDDVDPELQDPEEEEGDSVEV